MTKDTDSDPAASLGSVDEPCILPRKTIGEARLMRWVPVTERLPEESQRVLFTYPATVSAGQYMDGDFWEPEGHDTVVIRGVTHWTPLPAPPTGSK
jgi:hypothetical protein